MSELQATLEFCVELDKFYNVDLFLRGQYQLQLSLRVQNTKLPCRVEINSTHGPLTNNTTSSTTTNTTGGNTKGLSKSAKDHLYHHHETSSSKSNTTSGVSSSASPSTSSNLSCGEAGENSKSTRQFRILFRNEELELKEVFLFRIHFQQELVSISKLIEELNKVEYFLDVKLCYNDAIVSTRTCQIQYYLNSGSIHYYRPIFFDYFHLCAVSFSCHGGLIAIHISKGTLLQGGGGKPDLVLGAIGGGSTSCIPSSSSFLSSQNKLLTQAKATHEFVMNILLESNASLRTKLVEFLQVLGKQDLVEGFKGFVYTDLQATNFDSFMKEGKKTPQELEDFLLKAHKQITHLCAENILLWHRFLDLIVGKDPVRVYLANLHHQLRVKRFSQGFYITENPLRSAYTNKDYTPVVELLKKTINYTPLLIECTEIDGDCQTIPIVFEDQYTPAEVEIEKQVEKQKIIESECSCGVAEKLHSLETRSRSTVVSPAELSAKLTLLLRTQESTSTNSSGSNGGRRGGAPIPKKLSNSTHTLPRPRRHSSHHHTPKRKNKKKLERRFNSTPFLNEACNNNGGNHQDHSHHHNHHQHHHQHAGRGLSDDEEGSLTSEESGWVSSDGSNNGISDEEGSMGEKDPIPLLPPPLPFIDKINPPENFRDTNTTVAISTTGTGDIMKGLPPIGPDKVELSLSCACPSVHHNLGNTPPPASGKNSSSSNNTATTATMTSATKVNNKEKNQNKPSSIPYFLIPDELRIFHPKGLHLIICVHGLDGSCHDLRLLKVYLQVSLPGHNLHFLMSETNQDGTTFTDFDNMTDKFTREVLNYMETNQLNPARISFVGHSLGNIIVRNALTKPNLAHLLPKLHTFLSLSGPHLGTLYNTGIVNMGMWLMQKWKRSSSLLQLQLKDNSDVRKTFMYKLSEKSNLEKFKYVLLYGSSQDRYVPVHSAHIVNCKSSLKDGSTQGEAYREMVINILNPILTNNTTKLIRYDVHHPINNHTANSVIGRAAHIAVLDSEIFIEKFLSVSAIKYFQ